MEVIAALIAGNALLVVDDLDSLLIAFALVDRACDLRDCSTLCLSAALEAAHMRKKNRKPLCRKIVLRLPDLDHTKTYQGVD